MSKKDVSEAVPTTNDEVQAQTTQPIVTTVYPGTVEVDSIIRELYVIDDGVKVEIKEIDNPQEYPTDTKIYSKQLVKGKKKGQYTYAVSVADFIPNKRVSTNDKIEMLKSQGLTAEEIIAKLQGKL